MATGSHKASHGGKKRELNKSAHHFTDMQCKIQEILLDLAAVKRVHVNQGVHFVNTTRTEQAKTIVTMAMA
jgi:hypothetical protein